MARALVVDDDAEVRDLLRAMLSRAGHEVVDVGDGRAAVQQLTTQQFDIVLLDVQLPQLNGLEVMAASNALGQPRPPVVMLSALSSTRDVARGLQAGASLYLTKPFKHHELMDAVSRILGGGGDHKEPADPWPPDRGKAGPRDSVVADPRRTSP